MHIHEMTKKMETRRKQLYTLGHILYETYAQIKLIQMVHTPITIKTRCHKWNREITRAVTYLNAKTFRV